ncbi:hypothetical protein [Actinomadura sp. 9N407]|uniref:hypothetical protein n=1 Tax=Actinomadura sp. 9N407 TaxID=3375154 RepID=UPI003799BA96
MPPGEAVGRAVRVRAGSGSDAHDVAQRPFDLGGAADSAVASRLEQATLFGVVEFDELVGQQRRQARVSARAASAPMSRVAAIGASTSADAANTG